MRQLSASISEWGSHWKTSQQARKQEAMLQRERELEEIRRFIREDNIFYLPDREGKPTLVSLDKNDKKIQEELKEIIRQERQAGFLRYGRSPQSSAQLDRHFGRSASLNCEAS